MVVILIWQKGRCEIVLKQLQCCPSARVLWPISPSAAELKYANESATFIQYMQGTVWLVCDYTQHLKRRHLCCSLGFWLKCCREDWAADRQSCTETLPGIVTVTHTQIYKPNLGSRLPHLSRKQMEAYSMKSLMDDMQISRTVSLYFSDGKRNGSMVALFTLDTKTTNTTNIWLLSFSRKIQIGIHSRVICLYNICKYLLAQVLISYDGNMTPRWTRSLALLFLRSAMKHFKVEGPLWSFCVMLEARHQFTIVDSISNLKLVTGALC